MAAMFLLITLARAADLPTSPRPRTHTAIVLMHSGEITFGAAAVTAAVGGFLLTNPFWHGGDGCGLMLAQGKDPCGTFTFWPGLALTSAGAVVGASAVPLVVVGLALPRERDRLGAVDGPSISWSVMPGGVRVSGRF